MPVINIFRRVLGLVAWPIRLVITQFIIPRLARRIIDRIDARSCRTISYSSFLGVRFVVKVNELHRMEREVKSLQFVAKNTSIPVPCVYDAWRHPLSPDAGRFVMEYIPGKSLRYRWTHLSIEQKNHVFSQLRSYLKELRKLPRPHSIGRVESLIGSCFDIRLVDGPYGPFENEEEFHNWRLHA